MHLHRNPLKFSAGRSGSLAVVGTGIKERYHISAEAVAIVEYAEKVFYAVTHKITEDYICNLNPNSESILDFYKDGKDRNHTYAEMVQCILQPVRDGRRVCAVFYGHPGVFVHPSHEAMRIAENEGYDVRMLPSISAEDCLFADLGVDPGLHGCQSFEATDFLLRRRIFDPRSSLILWQVGSIACGHYSQSGNYDLKGLRVLAEVLGENYSQTHVMIFYCAATLAIGAPTMIRVALSNLAECSIHGGYTLYVPPIAQTQSDPTMLKRLGIG